MGLFYEVKIHLQPWDSQNACHSLNNKVITYDHVLFVGFSLNSVETKKKHFRKSTLSVAWAFCLISSLCTRKPREMAKSMPTYKPLAHERFLSLCSVQSSPYKFPKTSWPWRDKYNKRSHFLTSNPSLNSKKYFNEFCVQLIEYRCWGV